MTHGMIEAVAWTLVHFVWQGALVALLAFAAGRLARGSRPEVRYGIYCGALGVMVLAAAATFLVASAGSESVPIGIAPALAATAELAAAPLSGSPATPSVAWLPILVQIWLGGVLVLSIRSLGGWALAQRLKIWRTEPAAMSIQMGAARLRQRLGMRRAVRVLRSSIASVPSAVGWLRPVVLLPVSTLTALTPEQIEMVVAHELAHIRRHDYLVNLLQTAIETLLFYHPAVWWVSGRIRAEREHCCDDLAVAACGNRLGYAEALAALEGVSHRPAVLAVAADGGSLLGRIRRLARRDGERMDAPPAWLGGLIPVALVLIAAGASTPAPQAAPEPASAPAPQARPRSGFLGGLSDAGYTNITVDEIIALKEHGVEPGYIKRMLGAGLGTPKVKDLIRLREHGVEPEYVASVTGSGLVDDINVDSVIRMRENGVDGSDLAAIRALGFGPYPSGDVIRVRQHGADEHTFAALKEAGAQRAAVADAIEFRDNGITVERVRELKRQGFTQLTLEQIVKLCRAGVI